MFFYFFFFFQAEDGIRDLIVTGVQTCALPISIQRDLDHHARHQSRNRARGRWMGAWEPAVERHKTGLGAEADEGGGDEDPSCDRAGGWTYEGQLEERH